MVAPYAQQPIEIDVITELNSKPYVDMTLAIMKDFGINIERDNYSQFTIHPTGYSPLSTYAIESDASAASYFFAAPAICGGRVRVENISRKSKQGDIAFLNVLEANGMRNKRVATISSKSLDICLCVALTWTCAIFPILHKRWQ